MQRCPTLMWQGSRATATGLKILRESHPFRGDSHQNHQFWLIQEETFSWAAPTIKSQETLKLRLWGTPMEAMITWELLIVVVRVTLTLSKPRLQTTMAVPIQTTKKCFCSRPSAKADEAKLKTLTTRSIRSCIPLSRGIPQAWETLLSIRSNEEAKENLRKQNCNFHKWNLLLIPWDKVPQDTLLMGLAHQYSNSFQTSAEKTMKKPVKNLSRYITFLM